MTYYLYSSGNDASLSGGFDDHDEVLVPARDDVGNGEDDAIGGSAGHGHDGED